MKIKESHIVPTLFEEIRLQEYAATIFTSITTRSAVKKAIKKQQILVNGKIGQTGDWILEGQKIELMHTENQQKIFKLKLEIVYEDDHIAIINKPAGYPTSGNYFKTIKNALPFNLKPSAAPDHLETPQPAHRLDNPTSGILMCAKTNKALIDLNRQFQEKEIQKTYIALIEGNFPEDIKEIKKDIEDRSAITSIKILEKFKSRNSTFSLIEAKPLTGRTHQIRIHLASLNCPILGESLYGNPKSQSKKGLFLSAVKLSFKHPDTGEIVTYRIDKPKKFDRFTENLRFS